MVIPAMTIDFIDMDVVSRGILFRKEAPAWNTIFALIFVPQLFDGFYTYAGFFEAVDCDGNIDNRLCCHSRNGRAADVLNIKHIFPNGCL